MFLFIYLFTFVLIMSPLRNTIDPQYVIYFTRGVGPMSCMSQWPTYTALLRVFAVVYSSQS